jgi:hypothetical protein
MRRTVWPAGTLIGTLALACTLFGQSRDPWIGTWKLNLAESKYNPGPPPRSTITKIEPWDGGLKYTVDTVSADGEQRHVEWSAKFDGKDNPVTGNPDIGTNAVKRINSHSYRVVAKKDGKVITTTTNVISRDGMKRTATATAKMAQLTQGQNVTNVAVFDRQ